MSTAVVRKPRKKSPRQPSGLCFEMAGTYMTPAEFDAVEEYDENYHYELVDGVLVVMPIPSPAQADPNEYLGYLLHDYRYRNSQGAALDLTLPERYIRTSRSRRLADRVIWAGLGRLPNERKDPATIAVEFVSRRKRDRIRDYDIKRAEYLTAGVKEYWIIDRFLRTLTVFRRGKPRKSVITESQTYRTPLLPGFELALAELLAHADRWADGEDE